MTEKMKKLFYLFSLLALVSFSSCENGLSLTMEQLLYILLISIRCVLSFWVMMKFLTIHLIININV